MRTSWPAMRSSCWARRRTHPRRSSRSTGPGRGARPGRRARPSGSAQPPQSARRPRRARRPPRTRRPPRARRPGRAERARRGRRPGWSSCSSGPGVTAWNYAARVASCCSARARAPGPARRLVFGYGADDFAITGGSRTSRTGQTGTLVVGMRLASIVQPVGRLTLLAVAVSAAAIAIVGGLGWAAIRFSLRPVTRAAQTADAAAAGVAGHGSGLAHPAPERPAGDLAGSGGDLADDLAGSAGGLAGSLNTSLSELDRQF